MEKVTINKHELNRILYKTIILYYNIVRTQYYHIT